MALPNIGLFGYAGSGKDTVAEYLVKNYQYTRIAFADPLKEMALSIDPIVWTGEIIGTPEVPRDDDAEGYRLSALVQTEGWETAKRSYPEVRRFLRSLGRTMRDRDPDYWLDIARGKFASADSLNMPVVVTDVRHENEYLSLRDDWRFTMVRIDRPGTDTEADPESGTLIKSVTPDWIIRNDTTIDFLNKGVDFVVKKHTT